MRRNMPTLKETIFADLSPEHARAIDAMGEQLKLAIGLAARLRTPKIGFPWDLEQNHLTLRPYLIEEAYEVLDVLDRAGADGKFAPEDHKVLREELGDLLFQVLIHAQLCWERGEFNVGDVGEGLAAKLVSRHPHVFGDVKVSGSAQVLQNWEALKKKEGKKSLLEGLPKNLPSLQRAARIGEKAQRVGFDWPDWQGAWRKVEEEFQELKSELDAAGVGRPAPTLTASIKIEHEIGDLFFALCNLSRHLKIQPEDAHRKAIGRFEGRFRRLEEICAKEGVDLHSASLEKLDEIWERVKKEEATKP
jgi:MazG family protein